MQPYTTPSFFIFNIKPRYLKLAPEYYSMINGVLPPITIVNAARQVAGLPPVIFNGVPSKVMEGVMRKGLTEALEFICNRLLVWNIKTNHIDAFTDKDGELALKFSTDGYNHKLEVVAESLYRMIYGKAYVQRYYRNMPPADYTRIAAYFNVSYIQPEMPDDDWDIPHNLLTAINTNLTNILGQRQ